MFASISPSRIYSIVRKSFAFDTTVLRLYVIYNIVGFLHKYTLFYRNLEGNKPLIKHFNKLLAKCYKNVKGVLTAFLYYGIMI